MVTNTWLEKHSMSFELFYIIIIITRLSTSYKLTFNKYGAGNKKGNICISGAKHFDNQKKYGQLEIRSLVSYELI